MVHIAMHDAVQAIQQRFETYSPGITPTSGSVIAAAAKAAHDVLVHMFSPQTATLDAAYATYFAAHQIAQLLQRCGGNRRFSTTRGVRSRPFNWETRTAAWAFISGSPTWRRGRKASGVSRWAYKYFPLGTYEEIDDVEAYDDGQDDDDAEYPK